MARTSKIISYLCATVQNVCAFLNRENSLKGVTPFPKLALDDAHTSERVLVLAQGGFSTAVSAGEYQKLLNIVVVAFIKVKKVIALCLPTHIYRHDNQKKSLTDRTELMKRSQVDFGSSIKSTYS